MFSQWLKENGAVDKVIGILRAFELSKFAEVGLLQIL